MYIYSIHSECSAHTHPFFSDGFFVQRAERGSASEQWVQALLAEEVSTLRLNWVSHGQTAHVAPVPLEQRVHKLAVVARHLSELSEGVLCVVGMCVMFVYVWETSNV